MRIPKSIVTELNKRGWVMVEGETWRKVRGQDWACAYFKYGKQNRVCLITVAKVTLRYHVQILYAHPVCSMYTYSVKGGFNVQ